MECSEHKGFQWGIEQLSLDHRSVVLLFLQGFHYKEIAKIVRCNEETAKTRMLYGRKRPEKILGEAPATKRTRR